MPPPLCRSIPTFHDDHDHDEDGERNGVRNEEANAVAAVAVAGWDCDSHVQLRHQRCCLSRTPSPLPLHLSLATCSRSPTMSPSARYRVYRSPSADIITNLSTSHQSRAGRERGATNYLTYIAIPCNMQTRLWPSPCV